MKHRWFPRVIKMIVIATVALTVFTVVVMVLWNALVPALFGGPEITFWQSAGLLLLSHILLRGWSPWRYHDGWRHDRWRKRFEEKLASMSPEEREQFRSEWRSHCGPFSDHPGKEPAGA
jgi:hypothetical protein